MPEIFDQNPTSRVFHVDEECYVLYLGAHWDDHKPFLRLGTSVNLPAGLPPVVSRIVVPDTLTGSPLDELASLSGDATPDTHYIGDVKSINKLKAFLKQETITVEALKKADNEEDDNRHVFVYSYRDGNLKIKYHKNEIFDLHRRQRQDGHFIARAQAIKNEFGRSPFKFPTEVYQRPGFAVVGGVIYLIARGEIASLSLQNDYFVELARAGFDPDRLTLVHIAEVDDALVQFLKRSRAKGKTVRVSTQKGDEIKALAAIFRADSLPQLKVNLLDSRSFAFHRLAVSEESGGIEVTLEGHPGPIVFGSGRSSSTSAMVVDSSASSFSIAGRNQPLLRGCLYQITGETLSRTFVSERYLPEKNYPYRDMLSPDENNLLAQIAFCFGELFAGRDVGKVLRNIKSSTFAKGLGRGASLDPVAEIIVANTLEFVRFLRAAEPEAGEKVSGLANILGARQFAASSIPVTLPIVAEISYHDGIPYLFYRFATRITGERIAHANQVAEKMLATPMFDFESERIRLGELVAGLANPEQMQEARLRRIAERKKPQLMKTAPASAGISSEAKDSPDEATPASGVRSSRRAGTTGGRRTSRGGSSRWLVPAAAILLVLIVLGTLLATGAIPNQLFAADSAGVQETVDDTDGPTQDTTGGQDASIVAESSGADGSDGVATTDDVGAEETGDTILPEGWPPETLPAVRALLEIPGVIITDDRVIGPGGIEITVMDIINLVNRIATENGYAPMHTINPQLPNPDFIYPENVFVLPNSSRYTVVSGDTLWDITIRYMVARLGQDHEMFILLTGEYVREETSALRRGDIERDLQSAGNESHSENFSRTVAEKLAEWRE